MAKITDCPKGHLLQQCTALAGSCDGCGRYIAAGETVMDCRPCNYYLCDTCRPQQEHPGTSVWSMVSSLLFMDLNVTCGAPHGTKVVDEEVLVVQTAEPAGIPIRDPRHDRRAHSNMAAAVLKPCPQQETREALADTPEQDQQRNSRSNYSSAARAHELPDLLEFDLLDLDSDPIIEAPLDPRHLGQVTGSQSTALVPCTLEEGDALKRNSRC